jgi:hypothetical protein
MIQLVFNLSRLGLLISIRIVEIVLGYARLVRCFIAIALRDIRERSQVVADMHD